MNKPSMKCPGCGLTEKILWRRIPPMQLQYHCTHCDSRWDIVIWKLKDKWLYTGPLDRAARQGKH